MSPTHYRKKLRAAGHPKLKPGRPRKEGVRRKPNGRINDYRPTGRPMGRPRKGEKARPLPDGLRTRIIDPSRVLSGAKGHPRGRS